jgi:hypothetical protein
MMLNFQLLDLFVSSSQMLQKQQETRAYCIALSLFNSTCSSSLRSYKIVAILLVQYALQYLEIINATYQ